MKFPFAAKGVSKIFNAEIISLIAALIGGVGMVLSFIAVSGNVDNNTSDTLIIATGACVLVAGIIIAVAGIMSIVGYFQAGKDEVSFKRAILCVLFSIVFTVAASFFANQTGFFGWLYTILTLVGNICNMLATIFLILGLMALSVKCWELNLQLSDQVSLTGYRAYLFALPYSSTFSRYTTSAKPKRCSKNTNMFLCGVTAFIERCNA